MTIAGAFIIDLLLLALTLFVGQLLSDRLDGNNPTIAFQQSLFLNAFALIEFFKAVSYTHLDVYKRQLMSLEPALAALSGMVFLGETLNLSQTLALGAIIIASMGATLTMQRQSKIKEVDIN